MQNKHIILLGLVNRLISALWMYDTIFAMYPQTSQSFGHKLTRVNILDPYEIVNTSNTMHVFHCMAKLVTGGNQLYTGQLCPSGFLL